MGRLQTAAIANFLAAVSVGGLQGAAIANFLADVSAGRLQGGAIANFLAAKSGPKKQLNSFNLRGSFKIKCPGLKLNEFNEFTCFAYHFLYGTL